MTLERIVLIFAGLLGLAAFFFPFLHLPEEATISEISGINYVKYTIDGLQAEDGGLIREFIGDLQILWNDAVSINGYIGFGLMLFMLLGPFFFVLYSLGHLFRGLRGKQYRRGIFFSVIFMGVGWLTFYLLSFDLEIKVNFFRMAGIGFWMAFAALILAGISLFFEKGTSAT